MGSRYKFNSGWKTQDFYTKEEIDALLTGYLLLDQTTPQIIENGLPIFEDGLCIGNSATNFSLSSNVLSLNVNDELRQTWETVLATSAPVTIATGNPMGLLLTLTYQL